MLASGNTPSVASFVHLAVGGWDLTLLGVANASLVVQSLHSTIHLSRPPRLPIHRQIVDSTAPLHRPSVRLFEDPFCAWTRRDIHSRPLSVHLGIQPTQLPSGCRPRRRHAQLARHAAQKHRPKPHLLMLSLTRMRMHLMILQLPTQSAQISCCIQEGSRRAQRQRHRRAKSSQGSRSAASHKDHQVETWEKEGGARHRYSEAVHRFALHNTSPVFAHKKTSARGSGAGVLAKL